MINYQIDLPNGAVYWNDEQVERELTRLTYARRPLVDDGSILTKITNFFWSIIYAICGWESYDETNWNNSVVVLKQLEPFIDRNHRHYKVYYDAVQHCTGYRPDLNYGIVLNAPTSFRRIVKAPAPMYRLPADHQNRYAPPQVSVVNTGTNTRMAPMPVYNPGNNTRVNPSTNTRMAPISLGHNMHANPAANTRMAPAPARVVHEAPRPSAPAMERGDQRAATRQDGRSAGPAVTRDNRRAPTRDGN